jgi:hypothetical protein
LNLFFDDSSISAQALDKIVKGEEFSRHGGMVFFGWWVSGPGIGSMWKCRSHAIFGDLAEIVILNWHRAAAIFRMTGYSCQGLQRVKSWGVVL